MLSLPATRMRLMAVRAGSGLAQWLVLALVSSLAIPLSSPAIAESYQVGAALVHAVCVFAGGAVIYSLALFLSTLFGDLWRPWLITLAIAMPIAFAEQMAQFVDGGAVRRDDRRAVISAPASCPGPALAFAAAARQRCSMPRRSTSPAATSRPRGFAPRTPRHALSRAAAPARSVRVARSRAR